MTLQRHSPSHAKVYILLSVAGWRLQSPLPLLVTSTLQTKGAPDTISASRIRLGTRLVRRIHVPRIRLLLLSCAHARLDRGAVTRIIFPRAYVPLGEVDPCQPDRK